ncbi:PAAR domain-containing protein [Iodobacter sp.]|uniref:PAAR domain-containing protein n=1 Tax=Iodobacter sp. TaxID=1915058 RepID=UPI0025D915CE|nr:PAAR domain-containing protein [Iodobacter sp.]
MKKVIRIGDDTSHGGVVVSGAAHRNMFGKAVARVGDMVSCPIPGHGSCPIIEGDPSWNIDGKAVALEGHKTACGAVLFSSMPEVDRSYEGSGVASTGGSQSAQSLLKSVAGNSAAKTIKDTYDQHFVLRDHETDTLFKNQKYRITTSLGIFEGVTDESGLTGKVGTASKSEEITVEIFGA